MPKLSTRYNQPDGIAALDAQARVTSPLLRRLSVYDFHGVTGDGETDDTASLNAAIAAAEGQVFHFDGGTFRITGQLNVPSNTTVIMSPDTEIVCDGINVRSLYIEDKENVRIFGNGAKITKPRTATGNTSVYVLGCQNVQIDGLQINGSAKDGIYLGAGSQGDPCVNTRITHCLINDCRRQGISVVHARATLIDGCEIYGTTGDAPAAGIDLEANADTEVSDTVIRGCYLHDNDDQGAVAILKAKRSLITGNTISNNLMGVNIDTAGTAIAYQPVTAIDTETNAFTVTGHGFSVGDLVRVKSTGTLPAGIVSSTIAYFVYSATADTFTLSTHYKAEPLDITTEGSGTITAGAYDLSTNSDTVITDNLMTGNDHAIYGENAREVTARGNILRGNYGGINLLRIADCIVTDNRIEGSTGGRGIYVTHRNAIIANNFIRGAKEEGIEVVGTEKSTITGNVLSDCGEVSDFGIFIKYATDCVIANNTLTCAPALAVTYGIVMDNPTTARNLLTGNNVSGCGSSNANSLLVGDANFAANNIVGDGSFAP